ncbi:hypothetical protein [Blastococcus sp. PRF04-17]|uniref:hypothetical protein n=1 Tax=Blastococcus sp. PRF04-17 TaxID=2933797 RepID=UPI001FF6521F|nr:hypothetical protein [Blastococcus sp. PRF04-17]UOY01309.1 hypothetical protein MVA48_20550 [Blastococcus sp. PRF04-17]
MTSMTWTSAPAGLLGLGGFDAPACAGFGMPFGVASPVVEIAPTFVPVQGTGVPTVGTAVRLRQDAETGLTTGTQTHEHNYIGTQNDLGATNDDTLGIHPSRRPLS